MGNSEASIGPHEKRILTAEEYSQKRQNILNSFQVPAERIGSLREKRREYIRHLPALSINETDRQELETEMVKVFKIPEKDKKEIFESVYNYIKVFQDDIKSPNTEGITIDRMRNVIFSLLTMREHIQFMEGEDFELNRFKTALDRSILLNHRVEEVNFAIDTMKSLASCTENDFEKLLDEIDPYIFLVSDGKTGTNWVSEVLGSIKNRDGFPVEIKQEFEILKKTYELIGGTSGRRRYSNNHLEVLKLRLFFYEEMYIHDALPAGVETVNAILLIPQLARLIDRIAKSPIDLAGYKELIHKISDFIKNDENIPNSASLLHDDFTKYIMNHTQLSDSEKSFWNIYLSFYLPGHLVSEMFYRHKDDFLNDPESTLEKYLRTLIYHSDWDNPEIESAVSTQQLMKLLIIYPLTDKRELIPTELLLSLLLSPFMRGINTARSNIEVVNLDYSRVLHRLITEGLYSGHSRFLFREIARYIGYGGSDTIIHLRNDAIVFERVKYNVLQWGRELIHNRPSKNNIEIFKTYLAFVESGEEALAQELIDRIDRTELDRQYRPNVNELIRMQKDNRLHKSILIAKQILNHLDNLYNPSFEHLKTILAQSHISEEMQNNIRVVLRHINEPDYPPLRLLHEVVGLRTKLLDTSNSQNILRDLPILFNIDAALDAVAQLLFSNAQTSIEESLQKNNPTLALSHITTFLTASRDFLNAAGIVCQDQELIDALYARVEKEHDPRKMLGWLTAITHFMIRGYEKTWTQLSNQVGKTIATDLLIEYQNRELVTSIEFLEALFVRLSSDAIPLDERRKYINTLSAYIEEMSPTEKKAYMNHIIASLEAEYVANEVSNMSRNRNNFSNGFALAEAEARYKKNKSLALNQAAYRRAYEHYGVNLYRSSSLVHIDACLQRLHAILHITQEHLADYSKSSHQSQIGTVYQTMTTIPDGLPPRAIELANMYIHEMPHNDMTHLSQKLKDIHLSPFARAYRLLCFLDPRAGDILERINTDSSSEEERVYINNRGYRTAMIYGIPVLFILGANGEVFDDPYEALIRLYDFTPVSAMKPYIEGHEGD